MPQGWTPVDESKAIAGWTPVPDEPNFKTEVVGDTSLLDTLMPLLQRGGQAAVNVGKGVAKGAAGTAVDLGRLIELLTPIERLTGGIPQDAEAQLGIQPEGFAQHLGSTLEKIAEFAIPAGKAGLAALPSTARAGAKFQSVMGAAKAVPIDITETGNVALRIQQLAERGGSMPKVVRDFLRRATDPNKPPIAYEEARDFASNISRLSADEFKRLTPVVRREVGNLRAALDRALTSAASSVGKGDEYAAAMKEYRRAAQGRDVANTAMKYGKKAAITGAVGTGAYGAGKAFGLID